MTEVVRSEAENERRLEALKPIQEKLDELEKKIETNQLEGTKKLLQVEIEYKNKRKALLEEKNKLWTEMNPDLWVQSVVSCSSIANMCTAKDEELLANLINVSTTLAAGSSPGSAVRRATLTFKPNSLIKEEQLWIEVDLSIGDTAKLSVVTSGFTPLQTAKKAQKAADSKKRKRQASDFGLFSLFKSDADAETCAEFVNLLEEIELNGPAVALEESEEDEE
eukprot:TRINITY_DN2905_c0_g2_i1.p2 TRINITY_DN2905_c0_g2~~TRINITY_DN2905_c0_g2_i1.p2  ORF type:complete len:234 (+),score=108.60 TRINITY_DN2905_c0_g2_i1:39-704(+)